MIVVPRVHSVVVSREGRGSMQRQEVPPFFGGEASRASVIFQICLQILYSPTDLGSIQRSPRREFCITPKPGGFRRVAFSVVVSCQAGVVFRESTV